MSVPGTVDHTAAQGQPVPPGVEYTGILRGAQAGLARALAGVFAALLSFMVFVPFGTQAFVWLGWQAVGHPGEFAAYYRSAVAFERPEGMLAVHLGLGLLIPISLGLAYFIHGVAPRWFVSVQPGMRWRYLLLASGLAVVVLNGVLLASRAGQPWDARPQDNFVAFVAVILISSPIQAAAEEFFFRGYLLTALGSMVKSHWFGIVTSALVFALFHGVQNVPLFLDRFGFGLLAGVLAVATGGLEAGIAAHVINNICAFLYAAIFSTVAKVKATQELGWIDALFDLGGFAIYTIGAIWLARKLDLAHTTPALATGLRPTGKVQ